MRTRIRRMLAGCVLGGVLAGAAAPAAAAPQPVGGLPQALLNYVLSPAEVAGANNWECMPSRQHPAPVVLVHGTGENLGYAWAALAPMLANAGYCVFAFNYGMNELSLGRQGGLTDIHSSALTMNEFIENVRRVTKSRQVDLVGHSQGGVLANYYLKRMGGASKVRRVVGLAPSNHGAGLDGLVALGRTLNLLGLTQKTLTAARVPSVAQQQLGSPFMNALFADGDTVPGPMYITISTKSDRVLTPYTAAFLRGPNATNVVIQDQCPADRVGHLQVLFDRPALQNVVNALGPNNPRFRAACNGYGSAF